MSKNTYINFNYLKINIYHGHCIRQNTNFYYRIKSWQSISLDIIIPSYHIQFSSNFWHSLGWCSSMWTSLFD